MRKIRFISDRLFHRDRLDRLMNDEISLHIEERAEVFKRVGLSADEALRRARLEFGGMEKYKEACRETRRFHMLHDFADDLRFALRLLRKSPGFTVIAGTTLALGIGINAAMFALVNTVLLKPLPFPQASRIVSIIRTSRQGQQLGSAVPELADVRDNSRTFEAVGGYYLTAVNIIGTKESERVRALRVSADLFSAFGIQPHLGRSFVSDDERWGQHRVAIISDALWRTHFGADPEILGRSFTLNSEPYTIVGVLAPDFWFLDLDTQVLLPISFPPGSHLASRANHFLNLAGKLRSGVTVEQAEAELQGIVHSLAGQVPAYRNERFEVRSMRDQVIGNAQTAVWTLMAAVAFVLSIACANLASLLMARAVLRRKEVAIRAALGASRARLARQFLAESMLLCLSGGILGIGVAYGAARALRFFAATALPRAQQIDINLRVLVITLGLSVLTGFFFGIIPMLNLRRKDINPALKDDDQAQKSGKLRYTTRALMVIAQVAIALVLLAGAGLMLKSLHLLTRVDAGFDANNVLTFSVYLPEGRYLDSELAETFSPHMTDRADQFLSEAAARIRAIPGVTSVGAVSNLPIRGGGWDKVVTFYDRPLPSHLEQLPPMEFRPVAGEYFRVMGIRLLEGRVFDEHDTLKSPYVVVVNQEFARRYLRDRRAIGTVVSVNPPLNLVPANSRPEKVPDDYPQKFTIVGIVGDARYASLSRPADPFVYAPYAQSAEGSLNMSFVVKTASDPMGVLNAIRRQLYDMDPNVPVGNIITMEDIVSGSITRPRLEMVVLTAFGALALVLVTTGIYGLMSYLVSQRTREIGIRMALGAQLRHIRGLILAQGILLGAVGLVLGLTGALLLSRTIKSMLYGIGSSDPAVFAAISAVLICATIVASYIPAQRAAHVDPIRALRRE